jgi:hypothetical protein
MANRFANRSAVRVGLAILVALFAFLTLSSFLPRAPHIPSNIAPLPVETGAERTLRVDREQTAKDWRAAQKRSDARSAGAKARQLAPDDPVPRALSPH